MKTLGTLRFSSKSLESLETLESLKTLESLISLDALKSLTSFYVTNIIPITSSIFIWVNEDIKISGKLINNCILVYKCNSLPVKIINDYIINIFLISKRSTLCGICN